METLIILSGALLFFALLMVSIALHELGHLSFAKIFGVRVTQYMVGFGPTLWSRQKGETEYGFKWVPLGGYIRMIGMLPPRKSDKPGQVRRISTGPWQGLIESARGAALEEVRPGDEDRVFYAKKWWQKLLIMFGGPAMNILLAMLFFGILIMGIGFNTPQPVIAAISKCVVPAAQADRECTDKDQPTPAYAAGLRPGDRVVSYDGHKIKDYARLQELIRASGGRTVPVVIERGGQDVSLTLKVAVNQMPSLTDPKKIQTVGFVGISPTIARETAGPGAVIRQMTDMTTRTVSTIVHMPQKMVGVWNAAFGDKKRDPEGPISVVGASRIGGEILASNNKTLDKISFFVMVLAGVNFAIGMFNLIPLLPLDGGHIAGALWEGVRRGIARLVRRPDPGYVDVAKALPLTYAMAAVLLVMGALLIYADLANPLHFSG